jgi:hypothetical protein
MEPEGSLPHSQEPATCPCSESDNSISTSYFLKGHFNIIIPSPSRSSKWFSPQIYSPKHCIHVFSRSKVPLAPPPRPSRSWFDHHNNWYGMQIVKLPHCAVFSNLLYSPPTWPKCLPQHAILSMPLPHVTEQKNKTKQNEATNKPFTMYVKFKLFRTK